MKTSPNGEQNHRLYLVTNIIFENNLAKIVAIIVLFENFVIFTSKL